MLANNVYPDQMPHYVAFDLGLHCLPMTLLGVSRFKYEPNGHSRQKNPMEKGNKTLKMAELFPLMLDSESWIQDCRL